MVTSQDGKTIIRGTIVSGPSGNTLIRGTLQPNGTTIIRGGSQLLTGNVGSTAQLQAANGSTTLIPGSNFSATNGGLIRGTAIVRGAMLPNNIGNGQTRFVLTRTSTGNIATAVQVQQNGGLTQQHTASQPVQLQTASNTNPRMVTNRQGQVVQIHGVRAVGGVEIRAPGIINTAMVKSPTPAVRGSSPGIQVQATNSNTSTNKGLFLKLCL